MKATGIVAAFIWQLFVIATQVSVYVNHVYKLEKQKTNHTVNESRAMFHAARESGRVVQVGLHRRIGPHHVSGMKFLKSGAVGDVGMVRLFAHGGGGKETPKLNTRNPTEWIGTCGVAPAALRPFNTNIHPGGWRQYLDYGNGQLGDWGVHWLDQVLWWSEEKKAFAPGHQNEGFDRC